MTYRGPAFVPTEKDMPALDVVSAIYFSESSDLYRTLVIDKQWVDQLFGYFPDQKDPGMLMIAARMTDTEHAADVRDAINATLVEARTQLISEDKLAQTKSRLRYGFTSQMDNSGSIGAILASYVQFDRTPETINAAYQTYDALTPADIRAAADKYFVDSQRVTLTLSNDAAIAAIDGMTSVDELVAARGKASDAPAAVDEEPPAELVVEAAGRSSAGQCHCPTDRDIAAGRCRVPGARRRRF